MTRGACAAVLAAPVALALVACDKHPNSPTVSPPPAQTVSPPPPHPWVNGRWILSAAIHRCDGTGTVGDVGMWTVPSCSIVDALRFPVRTSLELSQDAADARHVRGRFDLGGVIANFVGHCEPWNFAFVALTGRMGDEGDFSVDGAFEQRQNGPFFHAGTSVNVHLEMLVVAPGELRGQGLLDIHGPAGMRVLTFEVRSNATTRHECD